MAQEKSKKQPKAAARKNNADEYESDDIVLETAPERAVRIVNLSSRIGRAVAGGGRTEFMVDGINYPIKHAADLVASGRPPFRVDRRYVSTKGPVRSAFLEKWGKSGSKSGFDMGLRDFDALTDAERKVLADLTAEGVAARTRAGDAEGAPAGESAHAAE